MTNQPGLSNEQNRSSDEGMANLHQDLQGISGNATGFGPLVEMMLGDSWSKVRVFRALVSEMADLVGLAPEIAEQVEVQKQMVPGMLSQPDVPVIHISPKAMPAEKLPAILYLHGGGLCLGSAETELLVEARWSCELHCVVIAPSFRLIPENPYPAAIDDLQAVHDWMVEHADALHIDPERVVVAGSSSGGLLAAALTHRVKMTGRSQFCAQLLQFPQLDDRTDYPSSDIQFADVWPPSSEKMMWKSWLSGIDGMDDVLPDAIPGRASDYSGLPPAIIHAAELDHGRDICLAYARSLLEAGVFVDLHLWGGAFHSFDQFMPDSFLTKRYNMMVDMQLYDALTGKLPSV